jgi:uncharacterized repeat protein (TIGR01451 family)
MNIASRFELKTLSEIALAVAALCGAVTASAEEKSCIEITTVAEAPQQYVNEQGQAATRLMPVARAVPGDEVIWTVTAKNVCSKPIEHVVVANAVPEHMSFVQNSAIGIGTDISYSLDGKEFASISAVAATANAQSKADAIRHIRWTYATAFAPGATAFVRYRATLN